MICLDPSLRNFAPWSEGTYTAAVVLAPGRFAIAVARHRYREIPVIVHATSTAYVDPMTIASRLYAACSRYGVSSVLVRADQAPDIVLPEAVRLVLVSAAPEASAVRVMTPAIEVEDGVLVSAVEIAAGAAPKRTQRVTTRLPPTDPDDAARAAWWEARWEREQRAKEWRRVRLMLG